jgi:aryl-alcohol dehydrogenase-like predicted oxidoreductase
MRRPAQIALAWVRQQPGITSTIIGAKTIEQVNAQYTIHGIDTYRG